MQEREGGGELCAVARRHVNEAAAQGERWRGALRRVQLGAVPRQTYRFSLVLATFFDVPRSAPKCTNGGGSTNGGGGTNGGPAYIPVFGRAVVAYCKAAAAVGPRPINIYIENYDRFLSRL